MTTSNNILVTTALPYANGPLHLGHMVEHIQADIWVRFQRLIGQQCYFVCGDDSHGTPIMISAERQKITPEQMIKQIKQDHEQDFKQFNISFDYYYTTHSPENQQLASLIFQRLQDNGDIQTKEIEQAYDPIKNMFLPDRYVKGECPSCGAKDQYGDNCENCGATYSPMDLKNPVSTLSGEKPITKRSTHFFFELKNYQDMLLQWIDSGTLQPAVANKLKEWFNAGLEPWDISRDAPYFGFQIPGTTDKYFYVWLDAPIGYMASFKKLSEEKGLNFDEYWQPDSPHQLIHFVGKDIVYFHALFWPAMLTGAGFRKPSAVYTHGFLTVNGAKMSKSRGTFITAKDYCTHLNPEYLRYYIAAKLTNGVDDIDLNFNDFMLRVNADLVNKLVNIASRCAGFIQKKFDGKLSSQLDNPELLNKLISAGDDIANSYQTREFNQTTRQIMALADLVNQYIDEKKPWALAKQADQLDNVQAICSTGINCFRLLILYLKPILPTLTEDSETFLNISPLQWQDKNNVLTAHQINPFKPLLTRIQADELKPFTHG